MVGTGRFELPTPRPPGRLQRDSRTGKCRIRHRTDKPRGEDGPPKDVLWPSNHLSLELLHRPV